MGNKKKLIGSIAIFVILLLMTVVGYQLSQPKIITEKDMEVLVDNTDKVKEASSSSSKPVVPSSQDNKAVVNNIVVQIQGAVKNPGIYDLKQGSRIRDLVTCAGGFTKDADKTINQAIKLKDEDNVIIYKIGEKKEEVNTGGIVLSTSPNASTSNESIEKVNLNTATKEQLMTIKGIGSAYADRIIDYRNTNGSFKNIEELKNISGIGDKTFEKLKNSVDVG